MTVNNRETTAKDLNKFLKKLGKITVFDSSASWAPLASVAPQTNQNKPEVRTNPKY